MNPLRHLSQAMESDLHSIADDHRSVRARVELLQALSAKASVYANALLQAENGCQARRMATGDILVSVFGVHHEIDEAHATGLRDQLDVALHVPTPERPIDPPSRL